MEQLSADEIKKVQLLILDEVTRFCDDEHLSYFLCGGTLLGAIRHKGFIPWDDDIDLMMPRPDYQKFIKSFDCKGLMLYCHSLLPAYNKPFLKVADRRTCIIEHAVNKYKIGINIDIFPIDGFPDDLKLLNKHLGFLRLYRWLLTFKQMKQRNNRSFYKEVILLVMKTLLFFVPNSFLIDKITNCSQKYGFERSNYAGISIWGYGRKEVCPKSVFSTTTKVEFEKRYYKAPCDYDTYLSSVYGDYMTLPPVEMRITHHLFDAYRGSLKDD